jgi:hypothetical protein
MQAGAYRSLSPSSGSTDCAKCACGSASGNVTRT